MSGFFRKVKPSTSQTAEPFEKTQLMAGHADPRTTKLYDRTSNAVSLDEVEQVAFDPDFRGEGTGCEARRAGSRPYLRC